jgi:signal transduction histidine kinase
MEPRHEELRETLDRLRHELEALRASRRRLLLAAWADRHSIERELHDGLQQQLVALAVNLQLAGQVLPGDPAAAEALLEEMGRDVQQSLDEAAKLAQRIHPQLDSGRLAAALRSAARTAGIAASVDVPAGATCRSDQLAVVHRCWLEVLQSGGSGAQATATLREDDGVLEFEVLGGGGSNTGFERLSDQVEALGGRLTIASQPDGSTHVSGLIPLSR